MKKSVVISGASGSIGQHLIKIIEENEIDVNCCAIARSPINRRSKNIHCIKADYAEKSFSWLKEYKSWLNQEKNKESEISLVLATGDISPIKQIGEFQSMEERNVSVNITSQVLLIDTLVSVIGASERVRIIQMDSGAAYRPISGWSLYCSAKAYMSMFLKVLSCEHPEYKIVLLDPGVIDTRMQEIIRSADEDEFPEVSIFRNYKTEGKLKSAEYVAKCIYESYIQNWEGKDMCMKIV